MSSNVECLECPCGLTQNQLDLHRLVDNRGLCTAVYSNNENYICGKPLARHPRQLRNISYSLIFFQNKTVK